MASTETSTTNPQTSTESKADEEQPDFIDSRLDSQSPSISGDGNDGTHDLVSSDVSGSFGTVIDSPAAEDDSKEEKKPKAKTPMREKCRDWCGVPFLIVFIGLNIFAMIDYLASPDDSGCKIQVEDEELTVPPATFCVMATLTSALMLLVMCCSHRASNAREFVPPRNQRAKFKQADRGEQCMCPPSHSQKRHFGPKRGSISVLHTSIVESTAKCLYFPLFGDSNPTTGHTFCKLSLFLLLIKIVMGCAGLWIWISEMNDECRQSTAGMVILFWSAFQV